MRVTIVTLCLVSLALVAQPVSAAAAQQQGAPAVKGPSQPAAAAPINLNTATLDQLEKLPGIGPKTAARIIDYRQKNGGFKKIEELMNVRGVGEKSFLRIKSQLTVTLPKANHP
jgi:competence protein ComEA